MFMTGTNRERMTRNRITVGGKEISIDALNVLLMPPKQLIQATDTWNYSIRTCINEQTRSGRPIHKYLSICGCNDMNRSDASPCCYRTPDAGGLGPSTFEYHRLPYHRQRHRLM